MTQMVDWLKHHWFLAAFFAGTVSTAAVALDDIQELKEKQAKQDERNAKIEQMQNTQAAIDERSKLTLDAVKQIQQMLMESR